ncbi:GNAT family N-acetyltransferase [Haliangium sp.]|uniref:GNAT family N-acetyltransferase n=1 Tax=Haliangium sp. TaxID=2663208 RepID=UPI003D0A5BD8
MSDEILIRELDGELLARANQVYAELAFVPSTLDRDRTFGAFAGDELIGLGRINAYPDGALEIGGFWVAPARRGQGLARRLVERVMAELPPGRRCYCVPFAHLVDFYRGFGMADVPTDAGSELPASIRSKIDFCRVREGEGIYDDRVGLLVFDT